MPALWWLLRFIPPRPRRIDFPPTRILLEIAPREETPARTPWWLTLFRLALAALAIFAAAGPLWIPPLETAKSNAPVAIMIDDGWTAAATWDARMRTADTIISRAEDDRRAVALIPLSEGPQTFRLNRRLGAGAPASVKPAPQRSIAARRCRRLTRFLANVPDADLLWLSDSVDLGRGADFVKGLAQAMGQRQVTWLYRRHCRPARADRSRQCRGRAEREVLRAAGDTADNRHRARA